MSLATIAAYGLVVLGWGSAASSPLVAVGSTFVDLTPSWLKSWAVAVFGTADKLVLGLGMAVVLAGLFSAVGLLARSRPTLAPLALAGLGAICLAAVLGRPEASIVDVLPTMLATVAGLVLLTTWSRELRRAATESTSPARLATRRFVILAGVNTAVAGLAASITAAPAQQRGAAAVTLPALPTPTASGVPAADVGVPGVTPWQVPSALFYRIDTALAPPRLRAADWSIRVWGEVEREVTLTWEQLLAKPLQQHWVTLACVSNEVGGDLVGNALWGGWPVRELLAMAGPRPGADMVLSRSADGWTAGTPLAALTDDRAALLAVSMNGTPLPVEHGFPVRLVVPGLYGYVSATKWVVELKVTRFAVDQGYWTPRGWSALGPVKLASRIEVPRSGARVAAGRVTVAGTAWAMHRGIEAVQVRVDDGPWQDARLAAEPSVDSWRQWVYEWESAPGPHTLTVRARSHDGEWQTEAPAPVAPDGATGHHTIAVQVG